MFLNFFLSAWLLRNNFIKSSTLYADVTRARVYIRDARNKRQVQEIITSVVSLSPPRTMCQTHLIFTVHGVIEKEERKRGRLYESLVWKENASSPFLSGVGWL